MVSIKTFALAFMVSAVYSQTLYSCWCGPNQGESRAACGRMADSGWMEGGRCIVMGDRARDYCLIEASHSSKTNSMTLTSLLLRDVLCRATKLIGRN
ncbi:hypothetical protein Cob_v003530 [Colletotrichum orbiculare MAFF 240422]|uniref:Secreted protein n=1 Tax=Colletotrichum orbiculare (strain 104-T / ATCC 96160 / CBS 514.97 / LARS 414 / MAFF 240422) TaxID=1213857 RepID=A0A484G245_COLOR|nr:hypothetical protein Cob_v003530 [Colletotrichum orbiculare MAFF 240422]